jgi:hypothetical protein
LERVIKVFFPVCGHDLRGRPVDTVFDGREDMHVMERFARKTGESLIRKSYTARQKILFRSSALYCIRMGWENDIHSITRRRGSHD